MGKEKSYKLNRYQALKLKDVIQERAKRNLTTRTKEGYQELGKAKEVHTNKELGKIAGVSDETILGEYYKYR